MNAKAQGPIFRPDTVRPQFLCQLNTAVKSAAHERRVDTVVLLLLTVARYTSWRRARPRGRRGAGFFILIRDSIRGHRGLRIRNRNTEPARVSSVRVCGTVRVTCALRLHVHLTFTAPSRVPLRVFVSSLFYTSESAQ